ncbi:hypoxia-inducible lipid droplet-associated protein [Eulemur rufifrons]|uniref:hypoxia-inducible lipid droplet-associated protein n=1 Tax=Eulemur rufifrons TaxID=859984 RepID=UPI003742D1B1
MRRTLSLYLLGAVVSVLFILFRLMETLEGLLKSPSPGSFWTTRSQLANTEPRKGLPDHPSRGVR